MTMSHKEALRAAREAVRERMASMSQFLSLEDLYDEQDEIQLRAYLDARGLVMVPREMTTPMIEVFFKNNRLAAAWSSMLAAAPDPFGGE